jgi:hypothetical protein
VASWVRACARAGAGEVLDRRYFPVLEAPTHPADLSRRKSVKVMPGGIPMALFDLR